MAGAKPIAVLGSLTFTVGPAPNAVGPMGVVESGVPTVFAGPTKQPVATLGSFVTPHGNPKINPLCVDVPFIAGPALAPRVLVGTPPRPIATVGTLCDCGHAIAIGVPNILVGV